MTTVKIKNLVLGYINEYKMNDYFTFRNKNNSLIIECNNLDDSHEGYQRWLFKAIEYALPRVAVRASCNGDDLHSIHWKSRNFSNYCELPDYNNDKIHVLNENDMAKITKWNKLIINHHKDIGEKKKNTLTTWHVGYSEYDSAMGCFFVEDAIMHLMTALESLLIDGNSELLYRISLYTAMLRGNTIEERKDIFSIIKRAYSLRSSVVHGDISQVSKFLQKNSIYDLMFRIRELVSDTLFDTYQLDKDKIIEEINERIFSIK